MAQKCGDMPSKSNEAESEEKKLSDQKSHLRRMCKEFEEVSIIEEKLNVGENMMRGIASPKIAEKHFSSKFLCGENVDISVDHFEFGHEELPINFLELFESKDCLKESFPFDLEKDPKINNIVPSFIKFLLDEDGYGYKYPEKCFTIILAILKNPYHKIEVFFNEEPVVKEQIAMAEYLVNCLLISEIYDDEDAYEKLTEAIIMFANVHSFFLAHIIAGFHTILGQISDDKNVTQNYNAYQIYCKVLNLMISLGATVIRLCLPPHFEKISCLASADENCDLYFHLLRACEILIANTIEQESRVKAESSDDINLVLFYTACYNYFESDLTTRLIPVFKKYEKRKVREEQYLSKKHDILPTKIGYMNSDMRYLRRNIEKPESPKLPSVNEIAFNSEGKVCFSNTQLGYVIKEDIQELSLEDKNYYNSIVEFSLSNLEV